MMALVMCRITAGDAGGKVTEFLSGSASKIIDDLAQLAGCGYSFCGLHLDVRSASVSEFSEMMERFGEQVLPAAKEIKAAKE